MKPFLYFLKIIIFSYMLVGLLLALSLILSAVVYISKGYSFGIFGSWLGVFFAALMAILFWPRHIYENFLIGNPKPFPDYVLPILFFVVIALSFIKKTRQKK
ncbi:MAG: hypothetical protein GX978_01210 [Tissierellia bacterium]|nr:hypothetical protein [Tissierellia bacterium]